MLLIPEAALVFSLLCSPPRKRSRHEGLNCYSVSENGVHFEASDVSLEDTLTTELEDLYGVHSAMITCTGGSTFAVEIVLNDLEFETYRGVASKESEWLTKFPESSFEFHVLPIAAVNTASAVPHAA